MKIFQRPNPAGDEADSGYARLEQQIRWYDTKSGSCQNWYKRIKIVEVLCAASIPIIAQTHGDITAMLGASILVLESLQHINQWQHNWITYRSTCEALRHEKYSFLGRSGAYDQSDDDARMRLLVDRVESLISTEHSKWISHRQKLPEAKPRITQM